MISTTRLSNISSKQSYLRPIRQAHIACAFNGDKCGRREALASAMIIIPTLLPPMSTKATERVLLANKKRVFFDIKAGKDSIGRIVIELYDDVPIGAQRFLDLAVGLQGIGYRLSRFDEITDTFVANAGVRSLSYSANGETPIAGGDSTNLLLPELDASTRHLHSAPGLVSLLVRPVEELEVRERLVAQNGKLVTVREELGERPNGTAFMITTAPSPELDKSNLIVGRIVEGEGVLQRLAALETVPDNSESVFFKAGKAAGDKRAVAAELAFNRPFDRVVIAQSGVIA